MIRAVLSGLAAAWLIAATPARAGDGVPDQLSGEVEATARLTFDALARQDWTVVAQGLAALPSGPLRRYATAEYYLAPTSPRVEAAELSALLSDGADLPQAAQLVDLAVRRGVTALPGLPTAQPFSSRGYPGRRNEPRSVTALDPASSDLEEQVRLLVQDDRSAEAEALVEGARGWLSPDALAQLLTRVGWSWYIVGDDVAAARLGRDASAQTGEWAAQGDWLTGLAGWRSRDCKGALAGFGRLAARATDPELLAAGNYWQARAAIACGQPQNATPLFRAAARTDETFYGLIARAALGVADIGDPKAADVKTAWRHLSSRDNVRLAVELLEIGQEERADAALRWQARLGGREDYDDLIVLAGALGLPRVQMWLGANVPPGAVVRSAARFPAPDWTPDRGWRVNRSLVFAHTLQESNFRHDVRSAADARGLMQLRPIAARDIDQQRGFTVGVGDLYDPVTNLEYGQSYLERLRDLSDSQGLLPKVIAAYNAGPTPLGRWNAKPDLQGDPLLWIESISYRETRAYVPTVLRNFWMYEGSGRDGRGSREALSQGLWPRFPGLPGPVAVRLTADGRAEATALASAGGRTRSAN